MVPSKWRPKSGKTELSVLPWPLGDQQFLLVLPPARWNLLLERLNEMRSEEHTSELQSRTNLVCRLLLEKKKKLINTYESEFSSNDSICDT